MIKRIAAVLAALALTAAGAEAQEVKVGVNLPYTGIGGTFCLTLCELAPERVAAAVLQNPIGLHENRDTWDEAVAGFAKTMLERDPTLTEDVIRKFGHNMFGGDFVFSVSRDFVRRCPTPLLLQPGSDKPHPAETSAEIARLAPNLEIQKDWRAPTHLAESVQRVADFLGRHTPKMGDAR